MNKAGGGLEPNVSFDPSNESSPRWGCMGPMVRFSALASATLVVLALAACSSSSTPQPTLSASVQAPASPSAAPQPAGSADCATVASAADVSAIVGETVTGPTSASSGKAIPGLTATGCDYTAADGTVAFSFGTGPNQSIVQTVFQQSKQAQGAQTVTGVGDSAYFSPAAHNLLAIQGTNFVSVGILLASLTDPTKEKAAATALAQKVLSGL